MAAWAEKEIAIDACFGWHSTLVLQSYIAKEGFSPGPVDGRFGRRTKKALQGFLSAQGYDVGKTDGWCGWPRQSVKALQSWARDQGANPGPIDGHWGRRTSCSLQIALNTVRANKKQSSTSAEGKAAADASLAKEGLVAAGVPLLAPGDEAKVLSAFCSATEKAKATGEGCAPAA